MVLAFTTKFLCHKQYKLIYSPLKTIKYNNLTGNKNNEVVLRCMLYIIYIYITHAIYIILYTNTVKQFLFNSH